MASEQEGDISKKKPKRKPRGNIAKMDISQPKDVKHLYHLGFDDLDMQLPNSSPGSVEETEVGRMLITKDELKHLIRSEVACLLKQELEPIKTLLGRIEEDMSGALVDRQHKDPADFNRGTCTQTRSERQENVAKASGYENVTLLKGGDNVLFSRQSSVTSETSLKKPMPTPRPDLSAEPTQFNRHTAARVTFKKKRSTTTYDGPEENNVLPAQERDENENDVHSLVSSETSVKKLPVSQPRRNTLPKGRSYQISRTPSAPMVKKVLKSILTDERECLAAALQSNIQDIVDNLIFTESELPDELAADSCITDEENSEIIKIPNRRDQIRVLISLIKGRDLLVLKHFLKRLEKTNPTVADKVKATLEENKKTLVRRCLCAWCELQTNVNIKYMVDGLWRMHAISDALFTDIARCVASTGDQCFLWKRLMDSLNSIPNKQIKSSAYEQLVHTLKIKNHYRYIAKNVETSLSKHGNIWCRCKVQFCTDFADSFTTVSSRTPWSSTSDVRCPRDKLSDTDKLSQLEGVDG